MEKTCVEVSFNKVVGLKAQTQVFFYEYCQPFKNNFFIDNLSSAQQGGRGRTQLLWLEMALFSKKALHNIKKHS